MMSYAQFGSGGGGETARRETSEVSSWAAGRSVVGMLRTGRASEARTMKVGVMAGLISQVGIERLGLGRVEDGKVDYWVCDCI